MNVSKILTIGISLMVLYISLPFLNAVFIGLLLAFLIKPFYNRLNNLVNTEGLSAFIITSISVSFFALLGYVITRILVISFIQIQSLIDVNLVFLNSLLSDYGLDFLLRSDYSSFFSIIDFLSFNAFKTFLDFLLVFFLVFYFLKHSRELKHLVYDFLNEEVLEEVDAFFDRAEYLLNNIIWEFFAVSLIAGFITFISLSLLGVSYSLELSTLSAGLSLFPVIKGYFVTLLLSVYYFVNGEILQAVLLLIISALLLIITYFFDNLFKVEEGVNSFTFLLGLVLGFKLLGFFGLIAGPVFAGLLQAGYETFMQEK